MTISSRLNKLIHRRTKTMSPVIFITGVSGYIGGEVVNVFAKKHPEWQLVTLVRNAEQGKIVKAAYPAVHIVVGSLDDHDLLIEQGKTADVVLRKCIASHSIMLLIMI